MPDAGEMRELLDSWGIAMRSERVPSNTIRSYEASIGLYIAWAAQHAPEGNLMGAEPLSQWLAAQQASGLAATTANVRLAAVRKMAGWLLVQKEITEHDIGKIGWAHKPKHVIRPALRRDELDRLLAACVGDGFFARRDRALFSFMYDTVARSSEVLSMRREGDVNLKQRMATVRKGKNQKGRLVPFTIETAARLDSYRRARNKHRFAYLQAFWIGQMGEFTTSGLKQAWDKRRAAAGLPPSRTPHSSRRGGAIQLKKEGLSTEALMTIGGWENLEQVMEYIQDAEQELAIEEVHQIYDKRRGQERPRGR